MLQEMDMVEENISKAASGEKDSKAGLLDSDTTSMVLLTISKT